MSVPQARSRLRELADELGCPELKEIAEGLYRRHSGHRAPRKSPRVTRALDEPTSQHAQELPDPRQHEAGMRPGIDSGRVSQALAEEG